MKILFSLLILLASCDCNYHLKKAQKKCGLKQLTDTVYVKDTTYIDKVVKDTIFKYYQKDTVIVREGRLTMKYFYNSHDSTVYLNGKCDTIKIIKEVPVQVTNQELKPMLWAEVKWYLLFVIVLLLIIYLIKK